MIIFNPPHTAVLKGSSRYYKVYYEKTIHFKATIYLASSYSILFYYIGQYLLLHQTLDLN